MRNLSAVVSLSDPADADFWLSVPSTEEEVPTTEGAAPEPPRYAPLDALERRDGLQAQGAMLVYEPETVAGATSLLSPCLSLLVEQLC